MSMLDNQFELVDPYFLNSIHSLANLAVVNT